MLIASITQKYVKAFTLCFLTGVTSQLFAGGDSTPTHPLPPPSPPPSIVTQDPCDDLSFLAKLNRPDAVTQEWPFNPLKKGEEYDVRENSDGFDYIYHAWYLGRADGKYPIYYWKRIQKPTTHVQSYQRPVPLVDICTGCVVGFGCEQINIFQNGCESHVQLVWKWADFRDVCYMLKKTPELKTSLIREMKRGNLFGALELKKTNSSQFLKRFEFYSHNSLSWENWKSNYEQKTFQAPASNPQPVRTPSFSPPKQNIDPPPAPVPNISNILPEETISIKPAPDKSKLPIAQKAEGKPGFVVSPYAPGKLIDATNVPSGTEVGDPYALGKTFLIP